MIKTICKNCGHEITGYKLPVKPIYWNWEHYYKKNDKKRGIRTVECHFCSCVHPDPENDGVEK